MRAHPRLMTIDRLIFVTNKGIRPEIIHQRLAY